MKRKLSAVIIIIVLALISVTPVYAGGDQVRGEKGAGFVKQVHVVQPPVPFP